MLRIILFLLVIALAAAGAAWIAEQPGQVVLQWRSWRAERTIGEFALTLGAIIVTVMLAWAIIRGVWRAPGRLNRRRRERRAARARHAITQGLLAVGHGDSDGARSHAYAARRHAPHDPLALLLQAQSAQLDGDAEGARKAFLAMSGRDDTKSLGLRGLYIEAQRADDPYAALTIAEEALRLSPGSAWAAHAVLGFRCARGDWTGALDILETNLGAGLIDKTAYRRQRAVLLTARAIETEDSDRNLSRDSVLEAVKLAPTLVPAAALASKYLSEVHQVRRAMRLIETAWIAHPHPDLAAAYADVKAGDPPSVRLARVETLALKTRGHLEAGLAVARAAIDAADLDKARAALAPFTDAPTQRVAMLMAEIEHRERDAARSRAWTLRAVRALHDPVWTADGFVSDSWRPVSPVTGRLDAFQWQVPLLEMPSNKAVVIDTDLFNDPLLAPPAEPPSATEATEPVVVEIEPAATPEIATPQQLAAVPAAAEPAAASSPVSVAAATAPSPQAEPAPLASETAIPLPPPPMFHRRTAASAPPVIPILRAPDDPGIDEDAVADGEFDPRTPPPGQTTSWRGYLPRRDN